MNERIDDLAFRAGCLRNSYSDPKHPDLDGFIVNYETLDKFAELIIREAIWIAYHSHALSKDAKFTDHLDAIKERFGLD